MVAVFQYLEALGGNNTNPVCVADPGLPRILVTVVQTPLLQLSLVWSSSESLSPSPSFWRRFLLDERPHVNIIFLF